MDYNRMQRGWQRGLRKFLREHPVRNGERPPKLTPDEVAQIERSRQRHARDPVTANSNLAGRIYGRLLVWQRTGSSWYCLCACGSFTADAIDARRLIHSRVTDCGCKAVERQRLVRFRANKKAEWGW